MPRTYRTLSLSLSPEAVDELTKTADAKGKTAARVAAEIVLDALGALDRDVESPRPEDILDEERLSVAEEAVARLLRGFREGPSLLHGPRLARMKLIEVAASYLAAARASS